MRGVVFPTEPERSVHNNALLERGMDGTRRAADTMARVYRDAGIDRHAAWLHESDASTIAELTGRGYRFDSSTRVMAISLDAIPTPQPEVELGEASWEECLRIIGLPDRLLTSVDPSIKSWFHNELGVSAVDGR